VGRGGPAPGLRRLRSFENQGIDAAVSEQALPAGSPPLGTYDLFQGVAENPAKGRSLERREVGIVEQNAGKSVFTVEQVKSSLEFVLTRMLYADPVPEKDCNLAERSAPLVTVSLVIDV